MVDVRGVLAVLVVIHHGERENKRVYRVHIFVFSNVASLSATMSSSPSTLASPTAASSSASSVEHERGMASGSAHSAGHDDDDHHDANDDDDDDDDDSDWNADVGNESSSEGNWDEVTTATSIAPTKNIVHFQTLGVEQRAEPLRLVNMMSKVRRSMYCVCVR